ncbi:Uma2 family endonuclease [uncultured Methylobacterium sp.]|uniref:Uma2 family endonuclease n=1 Tax=uncultured Methylobacterium sp. TaxID=157278 RepID=UPI0035CA8183
MALAVKRDVRMSVAAYQAWVESKPEEERWELLDGLPVPMSPPAARHQRIVMNLGKRLDDLAEARGCSALPGLAVLSAAMDDFAPIPDIVVQRGPLPRDGYTRDPLLVAEVLSPSTMSNDRGRKTDFFRTVASLQTFLIVYQDEARVEVWRRDAAWSKQVLGLDATIDLPELGGTLAVSDVYARTAF